jgi:CheY-like chemotaxis protein
VDILLIDDDPDQAQLTSDILESGEIEIDLKVKIVHGGAEAIDFLRSEFMCWSQQLPSVILLDLHMPKISGFDVLKYVKAHRRLRRIPVIIFSASHETDEITRCYDLSANTFIKKTLDRVATLEAFTTYWFNTACLPAMEPH